MIKNVRAKTQRGAKAIAQLRADRDRYQREKPTPQQLLAEGGHQDFVLLGELLFIHQVVGSLKKERERQKLTLADLSARTGIDQAALSKLETGINGNPTLDTLYRISAALGKSITCELRDAAPNPRPRRRAVGAR